MIKVKTVNKQALIWKLSNRISFQKIRMADAEKSGDSEAYEEARSMASTLNLIHGELTAGEYDNA